MRSEGLPVFVTQRNRADLMGMYDKALLAWPVPSETMFVATRFGRTHVIASGTQSSPPLVLVAPMGASSIVWSLIVAEFSVRRRVYALDTVGDIGRSELADPGRYPKTGRAYSAWLDDAFTGLGIPEADLLSASMGAWIAMHHAIHAPDRVRRLVLLAPMGLPSWWATTAALAPMISYGVRPTETKLERVISRSLGEGERANRELRPWMRIVGTCKPRLGPPLRIPSRRLREIEAPTLVLLGRRDQVIGDAASAAKRATRNISSCEVEILPLAGHAMVLDDPPFVGATAAAFLDR